MSLGQAPEWFRRWWEEISERVDRPAACIYCGHDRVWWNGWRVRTATVLVASVVVFLTGVRCPRVKCAGKECGRSWTLRPEGLMPRRHYQLSVVVPAMTMHLLEGVSQEKVAGEHTCSRRTVSRWLSWLGEVAEPAVLARRLLEASEAPVLPKVDELARATWQRMRCMARRAAENLCLFEALAAAMGMAAPGLQSVVEWAVSNRDRVTTYRCPFIPELAR
jgi:hypothetical protein